MNKKALFGGIGAGATVAAAVGIDAWVYYQMYARDSRVPTMVYKSVRAKVPKKFQEDSRIVWTKAQPFEKITIKNVTGLDICAWYLPAEKESNRFLLGVPGYRSNGRREFRYLAQYYHNRGFNLLLTDNPASGDSEGKFITMGEYEAPAVLCWLDWLKEKFGKDIQVVLHGLSMGGGVACLLSSDNRICPQVKYIVSDCGYSDFDQQLNNMIHYAHLPIFPIKQGVYLANRVVQHFDFRKIRPMDSVTKALVPMLFIQGSRDKLVLPDMVYDLYNNCPTDKELFMAKNAGHLASYRKHPEEYEEKLKAFEEKYLKM